MVLNKFWRLGKSYNRLDTGWNYNRCNIRRPDTNNVRLFRPKMIKKKQKDLEDMEQFFAEELFEELGEDKVYAAS